MGIEARCHCGATAFTLEVPLPSRLTRCTCSFCAKRGVLWAYVDPGAWRLRAETQPGIYRWRSRQIAHHFCRACGCGTYSVSPVVDADGRWDGKTCRIGVNARLFEGVDAEVLPLEVLDDPDGYPPLP